MCLNSPLFLCFSTSWKKDMFYLNFDCPFVVEIIRVEVSNILHFWKFFWGENDISPLRGGDPILGEKHKFQNQIKLMKRKAFNAKGTSRKTGCPRGRPPSDPSEIGPNCNCGGVSGCTLFCQQFFFSSWGKNCSPNKPIFFWKLTKF